MKKTLILLITLLATTVFLFAAEPGSVSATITEDPDSIDGLQASLTASFDMLSTDNQKVTIGFVKAETTITSVGQEIENIADAISLKADPSTGTAKYGIEGFGYLGLFYQIQYDQKINVKLSLGLGSSDTSNDLTYNKTDGSTATLGWTLTAEGSSISSTSVTGESVNTTTPIEITVHDGTKFSSYGVKPLQIETSSYVASTPGTYSGTVIAEIDVVQ